MALDDGIKLLGGLIGVLAGVPALGISLYNLNNYEADRHARSSQTAFDNQMSLAKLYFERVSDPECKHIREADLLVRITKISAERIKSGLQESGESIQSLADLLNEDVQHRGCPTDAGATRNVTQENGIDVVSDRQSSSTYVVKEAAAQSSNAKVAPSAPYTVYIQYSGNPDRARQIQREVDQDQRFIAPAVEAVGKTPSRDEIRIYKDTPEDRALATDIINKTLPDARIVSLQQAYPNLRARTMEIWLHD